MLGRELLGDPIRPDVAIAFVIYLRTITDNGQIHVAFLSGSSRVVPKGTYKKGTISIPRAELNAADALAQAILQLHHDLRGEVELQKTRLFTDSHDVMGWLSNSIESFPRYITSRRDRICRITDVSQWEYISRESNPADIGTRPISLSQLDSSDWVRGPKFLHSEPVIIPCEGKNKSLKRVSLPTCLFLKGRYTHEEGITNGQVWRNIMKDSMQNASLDSEQANTRLIIQMQLSA